MITYLPDINDIYHADFKIKESAPYNSDSGSNSGDQFKPTEHPESEDEDNLEGNVEVESEHDPSKNKAKSTKVKSKKSKSKLGHKDMYHSNLKNPCNCRNTFHYQVSCP